MIVVCAEVWLSNGSIGRGALESEKRIFSLNLYIFLSYFLFTDLGKREIFMTFTCGVIGLSGYQVNSRDENTIGFAYDTSHPLFTCLATND